MPGIMQDVRCLADTGKLRIESNQASLYATVNDSDGKPSVSFNRKPILDRTKLVVTIGKTTYILHDTGQPRLPPTPPPQVSINSLQSKDELTSADWHFAPMAAHSFATPENVAMIVAMLGAVVGVTTSVIKAIEAWLAHKAGRRIRIKYEDFEIEIAGDLSEEDILSRLKVFNHLRDDLKKPEVKIQLIE